MLMATRCRFKNDESVVVVLVGVRFVMYLCQSVVYARVRSSVQHGVLHDVVAYLYK